MSRRYSVLVTEPVYFAATLDVIPRDDFGGHLERRAAIFDVMTARDPSKIRIDRPDLALLVLGHQQAHGPIEPGVRVRGQKLDAERRIAENQQSGRAEFDSSGFPEFFD